MVNIPFILISIGYGALVTSEQITSLEQLNSFSGKVGFLNEMSFHGVEYELATTLEPIYYDTVFQIEEAVDTGMIHAALVSGTPDYNRFNTFPSEQISIRAMFVRKGNDMMIDAIDRVIVNIIESGGVEQFAIDNYPYRAIVVHSCKPSSEYFDWPTQFNNTVIRVASIGNQGYNNITNGFWSSYYNAIETEFVKQYNVTLIRNLYNTSNAVLASVISGESDTTEPYMTVGDIFTDLSRKSAFDTSCITSATQDIYITKMYTDTNDPNDPNDPNILWFYLSIMVIMIVSSCIVIEYIRSRKQVGFIIV